jgi:hypothetical protein
MDNQYHNLLHQHYIHLILNNQLSMMQMLKIKIKSYSMNISKKLQFYFEHLVPNVLKHLDNPHMFLFHNLHKYQTSILMNEHNQPMQQFHLENEYYLVVRNHPIQSKLYKKTRFIGVFKHTAARVLFNQQSSIIIYS